MIRLLGVASSKVLSSLASNIAILSSMASSQPSVLDCHNSGIGSSLLACDNTAIASTSLSMPNQVVLMSGSLASPPFTACDTAIGLPLVLSTKLPNQPPLYTQKVGISNPKSDAVGMGSEKGNIETNLVVSSQHAEGSKKTKPIFTEAPHDFGPRISDYVGDLSKTWGNSKDWVLELQDGRKIVISLSAHRSPKFVSDQPALEGVVNQGMSSFINEGQIISWASECDGVVGSIASEIGLEGEA